MSLTQPFIFAFRCVILDFGGAQLRCLQRVVRFFYTVQTLCGAGDDDTDGVKKKAAAAAAAAL